MNRLVDPTLTSIHPSFQTDLQYPRLTSNSNQSNQYKNKAVIFFFLASAIIVESSNEGWSYKTEPVRKLEQNWKHIM